MMLSYQLLDISVPSILAHACRMQLILPLDKSIIKRQGLDDGGVFHRALLELLKAQLSVLVLIHERKDLGDTLLGGLLIWGQLDHRSDHLVDRIHNLQHLVVCDHVVVVDIVQLECPYNISTTKE